MQWFWRPFRRHVRAPRVSCAAFHLTVLVACLAVGSLACSPGSGTAVATTTRAQSSEVTNQREVAARVGDQKITLADVDQKALGSNMNVYQALHSARAAALDELIAEMLVDREASSRGISSDELTELEITSKLTPVTDAEVQKFFDENRTRIQAASLEAVSDQIETFLSANRQAEVKTAFVTSLREKAGVETSLDPPRIEIQVASAEPTKGESEAKVTIVEYSDFQ